jgi:hypothetical protein
MHDVLLRVDPLSMVLPPLPDYRPGAQASGARLGARAGWTGVQDPALL